MFFPKLRARAKYVFLFLAIAFAASFVLFGVGTGFGGLQDILLQERAVGGGPTEEEAREQIADNPRNAQAHKDLSEALLAKGEVDAAIAPLARYTQLEPDDVDAKRELASLYLRRAEQHSTEAQLAQIALQSEAPGQTFQPPSSSTIGQALGLDPLTEALTSQYTERLNTAFTAMSTNYARAVGLYKQIAAAEPNDPSTQLALAQTAEAASDTQTAITAYKRFLELAPEDPNAPAVRQRIEQLEAAVAPSADG
jgi:tetratricopeptide (TPR) repeat protein